MITLLPYPDYYESAAILDNKRLGKQRIENFQIMQAVLGVILNMRARKRIDHKLRWIELPENKWKFVPADESRAWEDNPAVLMWKKTPRALYYYQVAICEEWERRGFKDNYRYKTALVLNHCREQNGRALTPFWLGSEKLHQSHRANLQRLDPLFYTPLFGMLPPMDYVWPVQRVNGRIRYGGK